MCVFGGVFKIPIFRRKSVSNILSDCLVITLYLGEAPASHWGTSPVHKALGVDWGPPWSRRRKHLGRFQAETSGAVLADSAALRDVPAGPSGAQGCWLCRLPAPSWLRQQLQLAISGACWAHCAGMCFSLCVHSRCVFSS